MRNEDGLIDPDKVGAAAFEAVHQALDAVRQDAMREIRLTHVEVVLPRKGRSSASG